MNLRPVEIHTEAAEPSITQYRGMKPHQLIDWLEMQQEEAEINHLRAQIRTNGRLGVMEAY
jgi:hypothetical protein